MPLIDWLRRLDRVSLRDDVVAGLTVAAMLIPRPMAYAALAGMSAVTATVPLVVYAVLGTSGRWSSCRC